MNPIQIILCDTISPALGSAAVQSQLSAAKAGARDFDMLDMGLTIVATYVSYAIVTGCGSLATTMDPRFNSQADQRMQSERKALEQKRNKALNDAGPAGSRGRLLLEAQLKSYEKNLGVMYANYDQAVDSMFEEDALYHHYYNRERFVCQDQACRSEARADAELAAFTRDFFEEVWKGMAPRMRGQMNAYNLAIKYKVVGGKSALFGRKFGPTQTLVGKPGANGNLDYVKGHEH